MKRMGWAVLGIAAGVWLAVPSAAVGEGLTGSGPALFSGEKAYQTGDLITVVVAEKAQAQQSASTELHKQSEVGYTTGGMLGTLAPSASVGVSSDHDGGGQLSRQGAMSATVTALVEEVLPNGTLRVRGEQEIRFESGAQIIRVSGVARPRDISAQNEIVSYRLADAKIEYTGQDALHEKARTGFLSRFLDWLWIF